VTPSDGSPRSAHLRLLGVVFLYLVTVLALTHASAETSMEPKIVEQAEFSIIGIQVRTSNATEMSGQGAIPKQWSKFYKEGIADKIPNKADSSIYAVYTNYASDYNGQYDFIIGMKSGSPDVPPGMVAKKVPSGKFAAITSAKGPVQEVVPQAWQRVYSLDDNKQIGGTRAYKADFELYDQRSQNPQDAQVDLYIGLK
jgi:predicted transcriptional regulator YdeE